MGLPESPTDAEKTLFLKTNIFVIGCYQIFSLLFMFTGIGLFIYSDIIFLVYLPYVIFLILYFANSVYCNIFGKNFDYQRHLKLKNQILIDNDSPLVDIYLPCCGESLVLLENTYKYVQKIDYPNYKVYILDDKDSAEIKELSVKYNFNYISRPNKPYLKKAGNLRYAFTQTSGDYYLVLDADFCPRHDIINELIIYMIDNPKIAIVQSPQFFRVDKTQSWVERGAGLVQELFYRIIQIHRDRFGACICVGTSALYRRDSLLIFGGSAAIEHSEDLHTGFNMVSYGYKVKYIQLILSMGICPDNLKSFFNQQYRWGSGSTSLLFNKMFWKSNLTINQKLCYISGMLYYIVSSVDLLINPTYSILIVYVRPQFMLWYNLGFIIPSLFFYTVVYSIWSKYDYKFSFDILKIQIIQSYAHLFALIDKLIGKNVEWIPTNEIIQKKNNNFIIARIFLIIYTFTTFTLLIGGSVYRSFEYNWYNFVPPIILMVYHIGLSFQFMMNLN